MAITPGHRPPTLARRWKGWILRAGDQKDHASGLAATGVAGLHSNTRYGYGVDPRYWPVRCSSVYFDEVCVLRTSVRSTEYSTPYSVRYDTVQYT
jgi:hypothetical protein